MFGRLKLGAKVPEKQLYETFFKTHKELLAKKRVIAGQEINKARKKVRLAEFNPSNKTFMICLLFPDKLKLQTEPEGILTDAKPIKFGVHQKQPSTTLDVPGGKPSKVSDEQHPVQPVFPTPNEPVQGAHKTKKKSRRSLAAKRPQSIRPTEPEAYLPTPSLVDDVSLPLLPSEFHVTSPVPDVTATPPREEANER